MDNFLFELANAKYRMYNELYKLKPYASTEQECFSRIKHQSKYVQLLDVINMLPTQERQKFNEIEREYFSDAAYV